MVGGARLGRQQRPLRAGIVLLALLECATGFLSAGGPIRPSGRSASLAVCKGRGFVRLGGALHLCAIASGKKGSPKPRGYWHEWSNVESELRAYLGAADHLADIRGLNMPSTSQLRKSGMSSLADAIGRFGGVQEVAGKLGLRCGKPKGYWQKYANTRKEFEDFLAQWRASVGETHAVPTQQQIRSAGRQDLISAMQLHGGMQRLARDLDLSHFTMRRTGAGSVSGVTSGRHKVFQGRLWSFIAVNGTGGYMPSIEVLKNFGCDKLAADVERHGGAVKLAHRFDLKLQRRPTGLDEIEESLHAFMADTGAGLVLPSKEALRAEGRQDLGLKLDKVGRERVAKYLGLYTDEHAVLQAQCDTNEMAHSASAVKLAVKTHRPKTERAALFKAGSKRKAYVRAAPLFRGDTGASRRAALQVEAGSGAGTQHKERHQPNKRYPLIARKEGDVGASVTGITAARAAGAKTGSVGVGSGQGAHSLDAMKERFRQRLVASGAKSVQASQRDELELLLRGDAAHAASETDGFLAYAGRV